MDEQGPPSASLTQAQVEAVCLKRRKGRPHKMITLDDGSKVRLADVEVSLPDSASPSQINRARRQVLKGNKVGRNGCPPYLLDEESANMQTEVLKSVENGYYPTYLDLCNIVCF
ncbi:hypothetical protein BLNAU_22805 [Blattamonas nauphoetae]|uniref:Uncharacterized protein n=1 Tax=Blattamonas nauphoetae TaxID=2049346 RepID=A0ABQ9WS08_9EUKA|nr:hypothetical protein BLNAU_22805 [Blattamonas nauphoetae]